MASQLVPLKLAPGVYANGTPYQAGGAAKSLYGGLGVTAVRYRLANLVRWHEGEMRPVGGWAAFSANTVTGAARAIKAWADNGGSEWIAIGTELGLFIMDRSGDLFNITPVGFLPGRRDAMVGGGYGGGTYGYSTYGTIRTQDTAIQDATVDSLDTFGQFLVFVSPDDRTLYQWTLDIATPAAAIENAPTASSLVVSNEFFLLALGAAENPRLVQWCDQQDDTVWTPGLTNQAGDFSLNTSGRIMCAKVINAGILIFTDIDVFIATYLANVLVYGFEPAGKECGIISRAAAVALTTSAYWMGRNSFYVFNGYAAEVPCEVADLVFGDMNQQQLSKIHAVHNAQFGEATWFYPSANSVEIDSYVSFSYVENHWEVGKLARLCGADEGVYPNPLMVDAAGVLWKHETGFDYTGETPFARTGPIELGNGDNVMTVDGFLPDISDLDAVTLTIFGRYYPQDTEYQVGPVPLVPSTDLLFEFRQIEMLFTGVPGQDWRLGTGRLSVIQGGQR